MPRWTVLLPTHHSPHTLAAAITSVLAQDDDDFELLIVGDGCTDETRVIVGSYTDDRITFFDRPKAPGFGYEHRREVLAASRSHYVAFMSDDDLWFPSHLSSLGQLLDEGHSLAYSRPMWAIPSGHIVPYSFDLSDPTVWARWMESNYLPAACVVTTREALEQAGGWPDDVEVAADWALWKRILAIPGSTFRYASHGTALHFRASRRNDDHPTANSIVAMDARDDWWPAEALVEAREGEPLQSAAAQRMAYDPGWWHGLNEAVRQIEHHLALVATEMGDAMRVEKAARLALQSVVEEYASSTSWRVTRPLRWAGRFLYRSRL